MGTELARIVAQPDYVPILPVTEIAPIRFHALKALGVTATIAAYRVMDRLGIG